MKTLDVKGKACPIPLIMTKKAVNELEDDEILEILSDNEVSVQNITHFLKEHKIFVQTEQTQSGYRLLVSKTGHISENTPVEQYCNTKNYNQNTGYVIFVGPGNLDFQNEDINLMMLIKAIQTLTEIPQKPHTVIFMKYGVFLSLNDSPVRDALKMLEADGTEILTCGNCLEYFGKTDQHSVGRISNMFEILDVMSKSQKVIYL